MKHAVKTESGSLYIIRQDGEQFYVSGINVPNFGSLPIPQDREWPIERPGPWPPEIGKSMYFMSSFFTRRFGHPDRIPGGGKITSLVISCEELVDA